jgi:hypothetical protein
MTSSSPGRVGAFLASVPLLMGSIAVLPYALYWGLMQCDEVCESRRGWRGHRDAWQWDAQLVLAFVGIATSIVAARGALRHGWRGFAVPGAVAVASYVTWALVVFH